MITADEAKSIAENFVAAQGEALPGIFYGVKEPVEFTTCFYFDFYLINKQKPDDVPVAGGAPGFIVHKNSGHPSVISWSALPSLRKGQ